MQGRGVSANTHMIRDITAGGEVIPDKILTHYTEIDHNLYENRFIMTLINRLYDFVKYRHEIIRANVKSYETHNIKVKSSFPLNDTNVDFDLKITLTDESPDKALNTYNQKLLDRVYELDKNITTLKNHSFMKMMKTSKRIYPPIMKTNILMKNVSYNNAYKLWLFLDSHNTVPFSLKVKKRNLPFDNDYLEDIKTLIFNNVGIIISNHETKKANYNNIKHVDETYESVKVITEDPSKLDYDLDEIVVEDNQINEYYLATYQKIFNDSLELHEANSKTKKTALKRALRDTVKISNTLYEQYFNFELDDEIFNEAIENVNVSEAIEAIKEKIEIARNIREVKEVDYNEMLRLERRLIRRLRNYDVLLMREYEAKLDEQQGVIRRHNELLRDKKINEQQDEKLRLELENVKQLKEKNEKLRKQSIKAINTFSNKLNRKLKAKLKNNVLEEINRNKALTKDLEEELTIVKKMNEEKIVKLTKELEEAHKKAIEELELTYENNLMNEKIKLKAHYKNELELRKAELKEAIRLERINAFKVIEDKRMTLEEKKLKLINDKQSEINAIKNEIKADYLKKVDRLENKQKLKK